MLETIVAFLSDPYIQLKLVGVATFLAALVGMHHQKKK